MAREVDLETFAAAWADAGIVVDVREPGEYLSGHVPGALLMPLSGIMARLSELPKSRPVYVLCAGGARSELAAEWMRATGIDAYSVAGGTDGWARVGRPIVTGPHLNAA